MKRLQLPKGLNNNNKLIDDSLEIEDYLKLFNKKNPTNNNDEKLLFILILIILLIRCKII